MTHLLAFNAKFGQKIAGCISVLFQSARPAGFYMSILMCAMLQTFVKAIVGRVVIISYNLL